MPHAVFASGHYSATYNTDAAPGAPPGKGAGPQDLGLVEGVRRWQRVMEAAPVTGSPWGGAVIDGLYRGAQCYVGMTFKEWSPAVQQALWPFGDQLGEIGEVGRLLTSLAGELVLTAAPHTSAAANGPAVLRFGKAIVASNHKIEVILGENERDTPVVFQCFPYRTAAGKAVWFEEQ